MRIQDLDQIPDEAVDLSQFLALDDPSQTFKVTLLQLVDALVAQRLNALFVKKAGDAMTGDLRSDGKFAAGSGASCKTEITGSAASSSMSMRAPDGAYGAVAFWDVDSQKFHIDGYKDGAWQRIWLSYDPIGGVASIHNPVSLSSQGTSAASLVRKDYVDNGFVSKTGQAASALEVGLKNASWGEQTTNFRVGSAQAPHGSGRTEFCNWIQWGHSGGQKMRHTLWCPAETNKPTELWFATQVNTDDTDGPATHYRIYHQGFKPTPADIGAARTRATIASGGDFTGRTMACVNMSVGGRTYPLTVPLVAGTYWVRERGGESADRDSDFGVTVGGTAPNFTFTAVNGSTINPGATVGSINAW